MNKELKKMCNICEIFCGEEHDYSECDNCQGYKFYKELQECKKELMELRLYKSYSESPESMGR